jgi:hypothetical protein
LSSIFSKKRKIFPALAKKGDEWKILAKNRKTGRRRLFFQKRYAIIDW